MYSNNQSAKDNHYQSGFGGGRRGCGGDHQGFGRRFGGKFGGRAPWMKHFDSMFGNRVPVNIEETDGAYVLHVYAAGLSKEAISVTVKDDVLTIAYKAPETEEKADKFSYREYTSGSFERLFQLTDKVLPEQISAAYSDNVLKVTLPKNPEKARPAQTVNVA